MTINYNNNVYEVEIIRKNNKNIYIRVKDNKLVVTCNKLTSKKQIERLINDNFDSIIKMLNKSIEKEEKNKKFYLFGNIYDVIYGFSEFDIKDNRIYVLDKKTLDNYINLEVKRVFSERLNIMYSLFEEVLPSPNLKIRKMTSRWGVCNIKNKNVTLNYYLYKYDIECLDYVIIHELSHFIHPNHSKDFWLLVSKYCPNYKEIREKLKE